MTAGFTETAHVGVYADDATDLQKDNVLRQVHYDLQHSNSAVTIHRRPMPCTLVTITWRIK